MSLSGGAAAAAAAYIFLKTRCQTCKPACGCTDKTPIPPIPGPGPTVYSMEDTDQMKILAAAFILGYFGAKAAKEYKGALPNE